MSFAALAFVLAHPALLLVVDLDRYGRLFNPLSAPWRARFALTATVCLVALVALSVWRKRWKLSYEAWQVSHGVLAVAIIGFALAHINGVAYYVDGPVKRAVWLVYSAVLLALLGWIRIVRPLRQRSRPWRVVRVEPERGNSTTLVLAPDGHDGFAFQPGQFAWVIVGRSPFATTQHPFSFSSAGDVPPGGEVAFTIKQRGDFTRTIPDLRPGTRVYVDGPHGVFTPDRHEGPGFVLIGGGVGITPLYSILRTMAERGDVRPAILFFANRTWDDVTFREELAALDADPALNITVVHALEDPPEGWTGETGRITADLLRRHLPKRYRSFQYFICGPAPMMDAMEDVLAELGVPAERIHTERFDMV
jgi:predicted ferric reductase